MRFRGRALIIAFVCTALTAALAACTPSVTASDGTRPTGGAAAVPEAATGPDRSSAGAVEVVDSDDAAWMRDQAGVLAVVDSDDAAWMRDQAGVLDAWAEIRAGQSRTDVRVAVDPGIADRALTDLGDAAIERRPTSVDFEGEVVFWYTLGDDRRFSSLGGRQTLDVMLAYRTMSDVTWLSVRGDPAANDVFEFRVASAEMTSLSDLMIRQLLITEELRERGAAATAITRVSSADGLLGSEASLDTDLHPATDFALGMPAVGVRTASVTATAGSTVLALSVTTEDDRNALLTYAAARALEGIDVSVSVE